MRRSAFTLIELLVVIAIVAILAIVVVLVLNPAQLLMQARDSNRLSDLATLQSAIGYYQQDQNGSLGSANAVSVSIPDPAATSTLGDQCQGLSLLTMPASYAYDCAPPSAFRLVNGNGWLPINLSLISVGSPLGQLPVDPSNSSSSHLYYTYTTNGSQYELTAAMESSKYGIGGSNDVITGDGSSLATVYAKGTNLSLEPLDYGDSSLVGYWAMDEGLGSSTYDYSGNNASGSWNGSQAGTNGYYSAGKIGTWAGTFDGSSTYIAVASGTTPASNFTLVMWMKTPAALNQVAFYFGPKSGCNPSAQKLVFNGARLAFGTGCGTTIQSSSTISLNQWYQIGVTVDGAGLATLYINGSVQSLPSSTRNGESVTGGNDTIGVGYSGGTPVSYMNGYLDDIRVYNRVLTAAQIGDLYSGGK